MLADVVIPCWYVVCTSLLEHGEVQDEGDLGGIVRTQVLRQLCAMNPSAALVVHSAALKLCHMPGLAVALILDFGVDSNGKREQQVAQPFQKIL